MQKPLTSFRNILQEKNSLKIITFSIQKACNMSSNTFAHKHWNALHKPQFIDVNELHTF